jgi:hypothetical protein|tara:strand:- start:624 stop:1310 length:687 start_codon:yes stop_codon:yes gene_type:complete
MRDSRNIKIGRQTQKREKDLKENQWASKLLFTELPQFLPTLGSQLYVYRKVETLGGSYFMPTRTDIQNILNAGVECWDEGTAFTDSYKDTHDEGDSSTELVTISYDEGDASTLVFTCYSYEDDDDVAISRILISPIKNLSVDSQINNSFYYRVGGGSTFTVALATDLYDVNNPFSVRIKNVSGSVITVNRSGTDQFYGNSGLVVTFNLADGESVQLICVASDSWDVIN